MKRAIHCWLAGSVAAFALGLAPARGEAPATSPAPATPPTTAPATQPVADIPTLIGQLGDNDFHVRLDASRRLRKMGKAALPALEEARKSQDPEVHARAEEIIASIDRPPADTSPIPQADPTGQGGHSFSTSIGPGGRTVEVSEPGRTIHIEEKPGSIYMKVVGLIDGKQVTKEYKAKSAEQLKEEHPLAFALFQQHGGNGGMQQFGININGNVVVQQRIQINGGGANIVIGPGGNAPGNIQERIKINHLQLMLMRAMTAGQTPAEQQQELLALLGKMRQAIPNPQQPEKEQAAEKDELARLGDQVRSKIAELKLNGDFETLLPPKPQAPKEKAKE